MSNILDIALADFILCHPPICVFFIYQLIFFYILITKFYILYYLILYYLMCLG